MDQRIRDLFLEAKQTRKKTPEVRLQAAFELIEFSENLFNTISKSREKYMDEDLRNSHINHTVL